MKIKANENGSVIIVEAEGKFGVKFTDYELALDDYPTFGDLAAVIKEKVDKLED